MTKVELNSLLGAQWVVAFLLFMMVASRIVSGLVDPLRDKPSKLRDFLYKFPVRYRLCTSVAILTTGCLFLDVARLRYHWHVLWMEPNSTTWWEFAWRSVWIASIAWWVGEQYVPALRIRYRDLRGALRHGSPGP